MFNLVNTDEVMIQKCIGCGSEIFTRDYTSYPICDKCYAKRNSD